MKKILKSLLVLSALFFLSPQAAMAESYRVNAAEKLVSGIVNVATGIVELPKTVILTSQNENVLYGMAACGDKKNSEDSTSSDLSIFFMVAPIK